METRTLPTLITWTGAASDGLWGTGGNWQGGSVPGTNDDAVIDNTSSTVTVTVAVTPSPIKSLSCTKNFVINGGVSFEVRVGASMVSGTLTVSPNGTLSVNGASAVFTASGTTTINGANLYATNGGTITLSTATSYDASGITSFSPLIQATGMGSKVNLPTVTTFKGAGSASNGNRILVQALSGGMVDLSQVATISMGNIYFQALDGGQIKLNALTSFTGAIWGGYSALDARRGGASIVAPTLANLTNVDLDLGGSASLPVAALASFVHGDAYALRDANVGGVLTLPLTAIDESGFNGSPVLQASGTDSKLNLTAVTTFKGAGSASNGNRILVQALSGGMVDLSQVATISMGNIYFQALDGGQIKLNALTSFTSPVFGGTDALDARRGGAAIVAPALANLTNVDLVLGGSASLPVAALASFVHGDAYALRDANVGGVLTLPLTAIDESGFNGSPVLQANGTDSKLNLTAVTTFKGAGSASNGNRINVQAYNGGMVDLSQVATISMGNFYFQVVDGGQIKLNALTSFTGAIFGGTNALDARRGGASIVAPALASVTNIDLDLGGNATLPVAALTSFVHCDAYAFRDGGVGGVLTLPLTTIDEAGFNGSPVLQASGTDSKLNLTAVTTFKGPGSASNGNRINVGAYNGGLVDLSQAATISMGNFYFQAIDGGQIKLNALTSFTGAIFGGTNALDARRGGASIVAPALASVTNIDLDLGGNATLPVAALTSFVHGDAYAFRDGGVGGVLTLPLTTIDEAGFNGSPVLQASGTDSKLNLTAVTTFKGPGSASNGNRINVGAYNGGLVDLSQVATISMGNFYFQAIDGGQIKLNALTSFASPIFGGTDALDARRGGATIIAPSLATLTNVDLYQGGNATLPVGALTNLQHCDVYAFTDGGVGSMLTLPLTTIDESGFNGSPYFEANGVGSKLDLSAVTTWKGAGSPSNGNRNNVYAFTGGVVDLSHVATITTGNSNFQALNASQINLSALTTFTGAVPGIGTNLIDARQSSTVTLGSGTTTVSNVEVYLESAATVTVGTLKLSSQSLLADGISSVTLAGNLISDTSDSEVRTSPSASDTLTVTGTYLLTLGTVTQAGKLNITGQLTWAGGTMKDGGQINANGGLSLSGAATKTLDGRTLNDNGSGTWTGTGNLDMGHGAILNLLGPATLDVQNDQAITNTLGGAAMVNNTGTFKKSAGAGTTSIQVTFSNPGTLNVLTGTVRVTGTFTNFAAGALISGTYLIAGTFQFPSAAIATNSATIVLDGAAAAQITDLSSSNALAGFNSNTGSFTIQNGRNFTTGGAFNNTGTVIVGDSSTFTVTGAYTQASTLNVLANGMVTLLGGGTASGNLSNRGTVNVGPRATFTVTSDYTEMGNLSIGDGGTFRTTGTFTNTGAVTIGNGSTLNATGAYTQTGGTTVLNGGNLSAGGTVNLQGGVLSGSGTLSGTVVNAAEIDVGTSTDVGLITINGNYTQTGTLVIKIGGTDPSQFDQLAITGNAAFAGGTLVITLINDFVPDPSNPDSFPIITFGSHDDTGDDFAVYMGTDLGGGLMLVPGYPGDGTLTLVATQTFAPSSVPRAEIDALFGLLAQSENKPGEWLERV